MWQVVIRKRGHTLIWILFFCIWHKIFLQGKNPQIYVCFCFLISGWPQKEGLFCSGLWLWLHAFRVRTGYRKGAALVVRADKQPWFSEDRIFLIFLFCSSQTWSYIFLCGFVHIAEWLWRHFSLQGFNMQVLKMCNDFAFSTLWVSSCGNLNYFFQSFPSGRRLFGSQKDIN